VVRSPDESSISGTASREAVEQERSFTVKQIAQADRFLSDPVQESFRVDPGTYTFTIGEQEISFNFRGGSLREFTETLNRRGKDKVQAGLIMVTPGVRSLFFESKITGAANSMAFSGAAEALALRLGIIHETNDSRRDIPVNGAVSEGEGNPDIVSVNEDVLLVNAGGKTSVPVEGGIAPDPGLLIKFETSTKVWESQNIPIPEPPPGPDIPSAGSVSLGGIVIENAFSSVPLPPWKPPEPPRRVDNLGVLSLGFSDGSSAALPPITDSDSFNGFEFRLADMSRGKTITSLKFDNNNTHRDISIRNIMIYNPNALGGVKPKNAVSTAQDAVLTMDGIEVKRPNNSVDDLIPGVTVTLRSPVDKPIKLNIEADREGVKNAVISLVGNYNRLMAEINILTRRDERVIEELSYFEESEREELRKRLGVFSGDSTLLQYRNSLQRIAGAPYPTSLERELALLPQIGIGTDVKGSFGTGYDPSRLRGYLEIDEKVLDAALETKMSAIKELFGFDTDGDLLADTGLAYALETISKPYVENGGIISLKTGASDSRITQEEKRIETIDRQLAARETALKNQYGQMEGAYTRMERLGNSIDQFSQNNSNNNTRR
jgi:flagellar hook-associated protein 2